ncbi:MAG: hypothetical protein K2F79_04950, partial [Muribaculaceae bacterium]|nr:hypothetical protein [Muribaculaceae bacterium]
MFIITHTYSCLMIEKLKLILIAIISITAPCAKAYQPSHYAASSRLSSGHWVKISVDTTGVFAISHERLRQWGFQNPGNVAVYGFGGGTAAHPLFSADAPDDLPQTPSVHTSDGRLLFFAEGDVTASLPKIQEPTFIRNSADFSSYYFLCEDQIPGQAPQPIPAPDAFDPDDALTFSYAIELIEREVQNPGEAGTEFHGHKLSPGQSEEFRFHVDGFAQGIDGHIGHIFYTCAASSPTSNLNFGIAADGPFDLRYISSTRIERITDNSTFVFRTGHGHCEISPTEGYSPKDSDLSVRITLPASARTRYAAVDKVSLIYPRTTAIGSGAAFTLA